MSENSLLKKLRSEKIWIDKLAYLAEILAA